MLAAETESSTRPAPETPPGLVPETVAVLGAGGPLGFPIARNIARAGLPTRAWCRSSAPATPLTREGAHVADTPRDAAAGASVVITMLPDEDAVIAAMDGSDGALAAMRETQAQAPGRGRSRPALWVQMSAIGEAATRRCAELARRDGVEFVDAPVLGTRQPAEEGKLVVLESGPEEARPRLAPVFAAIGQHTIHAGEAGAGSRLKLVASSWVLAVVEAAAETITPPETRAAACRARAGQHPGLLRLALAARDASLVRGAAEEHGLNLPLLDALARRYTET